jgi:hypothetical protein
VYATRTAPHPLISVVAVHVRITSASLCSSADCLSRGVGQAYPLANGVARFYNAPHLMSDF